MSSLKLTIRCADQANEDLKIDQVRSDWTVRQLKIYLSDVHPSKPVPERQRIVFAGQLLRDEARLSDYFNRYDVDSASSNKCNEPYVLHLVYTTSVEASVAAAENRAKKENELRQRKPFSSTNSAVGEQSQQRNEQTPPVVATSSPYSTYAWPWMAGQQIQGLAAPTNTDDWIRQQQQMYAAMNVMMSQWYGQYMQASYGMGAGGFYPAAAIQQPTANFGNVMQQQPEPVAQQQEVPLAQAPPQQAMNAQGGIAAADDEDDPRNRDWLDYIYMACRASLLLMILYFYSSVERFIFVVLCCTLMYGLQAGWFGRRGQRDGQRQRGAAGPAPAPQDPQQQINNAAANLAPQAGRENDAGVLPNPAPGAEPQQQQGQQDVPDRRAQQNAVEELPMTAWNVFWSTCWTFISSFASLVPERPPPLNL